MGKISKSQAIETIAKIIEECDTIKANCNKVLQYILEDDDRWSPQAVVQHDTPINSSWPNVKNCIRNCKKCNARCLHRKEKHESTEIDENDKKHNGWVDIMDKNAMNKMFSGFSI